VINVLNAEVVPMPLTFDTLQQMLSYTAQTPGTLRVVEVIDNSERVLVDTSAPRHKGWRHSKPTSHGRRR